MSVWRLSDLITKAKSGDRASIESLLAKYEPLIKTQTERAHRYNPFLEVADLRQEASMAVIVALGKYDLKPGYPAGSFTNWVKRAVIRAMDHEVKRKGARCGGSMPGELHLDGPGLTWDDTEEGGDTLGEEIAAPESVEDRVIGRIAAVDMLRGLDPREQEIVLCAALGERNFDQAPRFGISRQRVQQIIAEVGEQIHEMREAA